MGVLVKKNYNLAFVQQLFTFRALLLAESHYVEHFWPNTTLVSNTHTNTQ